MVLDLKLADRRALELYEEKFKEMCPGKNRDEGLALHIAEAEPSPRIIKNHYPLSLLPEDILDRTMVRGAHS